MASGEVVFGYAALSCWECAVFGGFFLFVCFWLLLVLVAWFVFCDLFPKGFLWCSSIHQFVLCKHCLGKVLQSVVVTKLSLFSLFIFNQRRVVVVVL